MPHEAGPRPAERKRTAAPERLAGELRTIAGEVEANLALMEAMLAGGAPPEREALSSLRLQFSRSLGRHFKLVREQVLPALMVRGNGRAHDAARDVSRALQDYHSEAAHHVAAWPTVNAIEDWDGYRRSAGAMFARLHRLLKTERSQVHSHLVTADGRVSG